jgi:chaperonin GroES
VQPLPDVSEEGLMPVFVPYDDCIVVHCIATPSVNDAGLALPEARRVDDQPVTGTVVAVGPGPRSAAGQRCPLVVQPGQRVLVSRHAGEPVHFDGIEHLVVHERDVLGVIEEG